MHEVVKRYCLLEYISTYLSLFITVTNACFVGIYATSSMTSLTLLHNDFILYNTDPVIKLVNNSQR